MKSNILPEMIPSELREIDQWVCWRYEDRKGKKTKIPINAATGYEADCTKRSDCASFDAAMQRFGKGKNLDGGGIVFHNDDAYRSSVNSTRIGQPKLFEIGGGE